MHLMSHIQLVSYEMAEVKLGLPAESETTDKLPCLFTVSILFFYFESGTQMANVKQKSSTI